MFKKIISITLIGLFTVTSLSIAFSYAFPLLIKKTELKTVMIKNVPYIKYSDAQFLGIKEKTIDKKKYIDEYFGVAEPLIRS